MAERLSASAGWELADAIRNLQRPQRESASGTAVFQRRDPDGTCWVTLPGSDAETPVNGEAVASASPGDEVRYEIRDGMLSITGNTTDPAVGQTVVSGMVERARETVTQAVTEVGGIAGAAQRVANAINQHFWTDTNGIHVTESTREDWAESQTGPNVLINSLGQLFRDGLNNLLSLLPAQTQADTFTGDGTTTTFTLSETPVSITSVTVGGAATAYSISGTTLTLTTAPASGSEVVVAYRTSNSNVAIFNGEGNASSNVIARFGEDGVQIGYDSASHIVMTPEHMAMTNYSGTNEFFWIDANTGSFSNGVRGSSGYDGGRFSGTFGLGNVAEPSVDGEMDFGIGAFAHGSGCSAYGDGAFAGGKTTVANQAAFAHGIHVIAARRQAVFGQYNIEDTSNEYLFIIGNGTSDNARSNAFAVDWDGVVDCGGIEPKWVTIDPATFFSSMNSGWANDTSYTQLAYSPTLHRMAGRIRINSTAAHSAGNNVIGVIAPEYRPYIRALCNTTTTDAYKMYIDANGNATIALPSATTASTASFYFVADYTIA